MEGSSVESRYTGEMWGLSDEEASERRAQGQGNDYRLKTSRSYGEIVRENLLTFFNLVLILLGILLAVLGKPVEAVITSGVLLINVVVATVQEVRAKRTLDHIALLTRPQARVIREGNERTVDPGRIVYGDLLVVEPGDQIVVDGEIIGDSRLDVDESLLTGESEPVAKRAGDTVYSGSFCVTGRGIFQAKRVGAASLVNELTAEARVFVRNFTPMQREVNLFIRILLALITFFGILRIISAILNEVPFVESVRETSVLFGLAPSSLFLMIVVAYAIGAVRIANKGALAQQANAVESLCHVTVLCLDKTGTLTTNRIILEEVVPIRAGTFELSDEELHRNLGVFARSATGGNRTNEAIVNALQGRALPGLQEVPFSSARGWSAISFDLEEMRGVYALGAPEILQAHLAFEPAIEQQMEALSIEGYRLVLFAHQPEPRPLYDDGSQARLPGDLIPLALLVFSDELRPDTRETLHGFARAGIQLKIISGDHPETVAALAKQAGIGADGEPLKVASGLALEKMDDAQFAQAVQDTTIFGRIAPHQKERLVSEMRRQGAYVAMTGDGVNDVLALKQANLGIAMESGSQATRSVADLILLNDSFAALPEAFMEGQRIISGMLDILRLYMTRILYLAALVTAISVIGVGFPFTPKQNAIISVITLSFPAFFLAIWAKPEPVHSGSLSRKLAHFVIPAVVTISAAGLVVYIYFLVTTRDLAYTQQTLTYTMIACGNLLVIFVEPVTRRLAVGDAFSGDWRPTILAFSLFFIFAIFVIVPPLRDLYGLTPLRGRLDYLFIAGIVLLWAIILRYVWRARLIDRYLNINLSGAAGIPADLSSGNH